jgi:hypothetical protein
MEQELNGSEISIFGAIFSLIVMIGSIAFFSWLFYPRDFPVDADYYQTQDRITIRLDNSRCRACHVGYW